MDKPHTVDTTLTNTNSPSPGATLDVAKMHTNDKAGVTLGEQQTVQQSLPNESHLKVVNKRATSHLPDNPWDLQSMLGRHNYVTTVSWDTTSAPGTVLYSASVPEQLLQLDISATPFKRFKFWRAENVTFHMQVTANRFLAGRLIAYFVPTMGNNASTNLQTKVLLQHVWLDPSSATTADLVIPFNYYKGYLDLEEGDNLGYVEIAVFNSLSAAIGTTPTIDVKCFMSVTGSEFKVPLAGGTPFTRTRMRPHSALAGLAASAIGGIADAGLNVLQNDILPKINGTDLFMSLLDKPSEPENPSVITNKDQAYLSNNRGAEPLEVLALDPSSVQEADHEHFATDQDEMDISYLIKNKMSHFSSLTWSQADPVGKILYEERVGPLVNFLNDKANNVNTRLIDYLAANFTYWRGGLKYIFDVVGTQFHEGRLDVMFLPGEPQAITNYAAATSVYMGSIVIRNGENSFAFIAPFLSDTPWKRIYYGGDLDSLSPSPRFSTYSTGTIQLVVSNQLRAPTNVPSSVNINLFIAAADDFEFNFPSIYNYSLIIPQATVMTPHGSNSEMPNLNNPATQIKAVTLAAGSGFTSDSSIPHFGESYTSLKELMKRYQFMGSVELDPTPVSAPLRDAIISGTIPFVRVINGGDIFTQYFHRILAMYRTVRGSMRFKIRPRYVLTGDMAYSYSATGLHGYVTYLPELRTQPTADQAQDISRLFADGGNGGTPPIPRARYSETQTAEFEIPFMSASGVQLVQKTYDTVNDFNSNWYFKPTIVTSTYLVPGYKIYLDIYCALGDFTRLGTFIGNPSYSFGVTSTGVSWYPDLWISTPPTREKDKRQSKQNILDFDQLTPQELELLRKRF